jgi:hypothetical protein
MSRVSWTESRRTPRSRCSVAAAECIDIELAVLKPRTFPTVSSNGCAPGVWHESPRPALLFVRCRDSAAARSRRLGVRRP